MSAKSKEGIIIKSATKNRWIYIRPGNRYYESTERGASKKSTLFVLFEGRTEKQSVNDESAGQETVEKASSSGTVRRPTGSRLGGLWGGTRRRVIGGREAKEKKERKEKSRAGKGGVRRRSQED